MQNVFFYVNALIIYTWLLKLTGNNSDAVAGSDVTTMPTRSVCRSVVASGQTTFNLLPV